MSKPPPSPLNGAVPPVAWLPEMVLALIVSAGPDS